MSTYSGLPNVLCYSHKSPPSFYKEGTNKGVKMKALSGWVSAPVYTNALPMILKRYNDETSKETSANAYGLLEYLTKHIPRVNSRHDA